jgi:ferredoxin
MIHLKQATCAGCGACAKVCPYGVLTVHNKLAKLVAEDDCIECGACQLNCHFDAISVTKGTG